MEELKISSPEAGRLVPELRKALTHPEEAIRRLAERALGAIGREKALKDSSAYTRWEGAKALKKMGKEAAFAVPELRDALKDPDRQVRKAAAEALAGLGKEAAPAMQDLIDLLDENNVYEESHGAAAEALEIFGKEAAAAVPSLEKAMYWRPSWVSKAASCLGSIGREAPDLVLPKLRKMLKPENERGCGTQHAALKALKIMGDAAIPALPEIRRFLSGKFEDHVKVQAIEILAQMGDTSDIPDLRQILRKDALVEQKYSVGGAATKALGAMAKRATSAIPELRKILKLERAKNVRYYHSLRLVAMKEAGAKTLAAMGKDAAPALPELRAGLKSESSDFKESCAKALQVIGAEATRNSVCCCINRKCSWKEYGSTGLLAVNHSAGSEEDGRCCKIYTGKCTRGYKSCSRRLRRCSQTSRPAKSSPPALHLG